MSTEICKDLNKLHPYVKYLAEKLLTLCNEQGLNIRITETVRTAERQDYLYAQGRTRPGSIVTYTRGSSMSSYHNWGLAFDICNNVKGDAYNMTVLTKAGKLAQSIGLEWGGGWSGFKDSPHFQFTGGLSIDNLKAGKTPTKAVPKSTVTPMTVKADPKYVIAVTTLNKYTLLSDTEYWETLNDETFNVDNVKKLIDNIAKYFVKANPILKSTLGADAYTGNDKAHVDNVGILSTASIISDYEVWASDKKITLSSTKSLILKVSDRLSR